MLKVQWIAGRFGIRLLVERRTRDASAYAGCLQLWALGNEDHCLGRCIIGGIRVLPSSRRRLRCEANHGDHGRHQGRDEGLRGKGKVFQLSNAGPRATCSEEAGPYGLTYITTV